MSWMHIFATLYSHINSLLKESLHTVIEWGNYHDSQGATSDATIPPINSTAAVQTLNSWSDASNQEYGIVWIKYCFFMNGSEWWLDGVFPGLWNSFPLDLWNCCSFMSSRRALQLLWAFSQQDLFWLDDHLYFYSEYAKQFFRSSEGHFYKGKVIQGNSSGGYFYKGMECSV